MAGTAVKHRRSLKLGTHGADVTELRTALEDAGYPKKPGHHAKPEMFDKSLFITLRQFQQDNLLIPDGEAGARTYAFLFDEGTKPDATALRQALGERVIHAAHLHHKKLISQEVPKDASTLVPSDDCLCFIAGQEASISKFYVPAAGSGVTIGVGFDMKERDWSDVEPLLVAAKITTNRKLWEVAASANDPKLFLKQNEAANVNILNAKQSWDLFLALVNSSDYAGLVRHAFRHSKLTQYQFDALVSHAYNFQKDISGAGALMAKGGSPRDVIDKLSYSVTTGGGKKSSKGLMDRRAQEYALFLYGDYGFPTGAGRKPTHK